MSFSEGGAAGKLVPDGWRRVALCDGRLQACPTGPEALVPEPGFEPGRAFRPAGF